MPFSSGDSLRAPASNATSTVIARVPGNAIEWIGRPLDATVLDVIVAITRTLEGPTAIPARGCYYASPT